MTDPKPPLNIHAGDRALDRIRERGLRPEDVGIIPGAAGGPKALGLQGLDRVLFGDWLERAPRERALIGSSIGSWRFACACTPEPVAALERLGELYTAQRFPKDVTPQQVSRQCEEMLEALIGGQESGIFEQQRYRLNVMVARSRGLVASDHKALLMAGLAPVVLANAIHRPWIQLGFERIVMHDERAAPPLEIFDDFPGRHEVLNADNLQASLLASGSIPMVMRAVERIPGVAGRCFRDGGLTDYHLDMPYAGDDLVLYPHFTPRVVPGWFDKTLPWRHGDPERLRNMVMITPTPSYLETLPDGRLPDRRDFPAYQGNDATREAHWRRAMAESERLGDYFLELVDNDRVAQVARPLSELG
ncbi:patatin-like phospholipase family protein [Salicola sp. Rm-C-2C1-2]|uniref:patatin-like phospholipase family protein n=1 Tax=Salicola sp. Rm-C-2C1-2 TaxID=3141321 RepID=UPI0032E36D34